MKDLEKLENAIAVAKLKLQEETSRLKKDIQYAENARVSYLHENFFLFEKVFAAEKAEFFVKNLPAWEKELISENIVSDISSDVNIRIWCKKIKQVSELQELSYNVLKLKV